MRATRILLAVLILVLGTCTALFAEEGDAEATGPTMENLIAEGKYQEALDLGQQFIKTYTEADKLEELPSAFYINLGTAHYFLETYQAAIDAFDKAYELADVDSLFDPKPMEYKATCYHKLGQLDKEIETFQMILEDIVEPGSEKEMEIQYALAHLLEQQSRFDEAFELYEALIEADPTYKGVAYDAGALYFNKGRLEDAKRCFGKALDANPANEFANLGMAKIVMKNKDRAEKIKAIPYLEKYLEVSENENLKKRVTGLLETLRKIQKELAAGK